MSRLRLRSLAALSRRGRFAILSALPVAALAVLFLPGGGAIGVSAQETEQAELAARLGAVRVPPAALAGGAVGAGEARALDRRLGRLASSPEDSIRLWNGERRVAYESRPARGGSDAEAREALGRALAGEVASAPVELAGAEGTATFVPVRAAPAGRVLGAFEVRRAGASGVAGLLEHPLAPVAALALLWLVLQAVAAAVASRDPEGARDPGEGQRDALTDLPNRTAFRDVLERALIKGRRRSGRVAVMVMDVDRFKEINDTLGHYNGDLLLKRIGPRVRSILRDQDSVARLGGDEFAILLPDLPDEMTPITAAQRVVRCFEEPFVLGGLALEVEWSVGLAISPEHGNRVDALLNHADTAMYAAKAARTGFAVYSDEQERGSRRRLALAGELRRAINEGEIVLNYQPKARVATGEVSGVEALARWQHPVEGIISPGEFIPIAERTNLLHALTDRILGAALAQLRDWHSRGFELTMAVNLSMRNLLDAKLADQIAGLLERNRISPRFLELELTEGMLMSDPRRAQEILSRLKDVGVSLSVDDFGTGYSSLAYLKDLPVDTIKIDRSFVMDMESDARNAAIVRSTVDLGRNLGLAVVAEGVETEAAYSELARLGCDFAQGYLLARPLPPDELLARVQELERSSQRAVAAPRAEPPALRVIPSA